MEEEIIEKNRKQVQNKIDKKENAERRKVKIKNEKIWKTKRKI